MHLPYPKPPSSFNAGILLFAGCCAVAGFIGWPMIKNAMPDSFPQENRGAARYDAFGYTGDPGRFDRWRNAERGGQREYSPYYPGPRTRRDDQDGPSPGYGRRGGPEAYEPGRGGPQGPAYGMAGPRRGMEEGDREAPPGYGRRGGPETYGSFRGPGPQQYGDRQGQYRQQHRECSGTWWNPFSDAGCGGDWQDGPPPTRGGRR